MSRWYKYDVNDVALEFGTDINNGRTNAKLNKKRRGDNDVFLLPTVDSKSTIKKLAADASIVLLTVGYFLSAFLGHFHEASIGLFILFVAFCISFTVKNASANRIINSYRLLLPNSRVIEGGVGIRLSVFDVEVGDLIEFSQGDIIPADARVVWSDNLIVAERYFDPLTAKNGYRKQKKVSCALPEADELADTYDNIVFAASMVVSGKGRAIVTETGVDTKLVKNKAAMRIISDNDTPEYFSRFFSSAKKISLVAFWSVIPLTLLALIRKSPVSVQNNEFDLLYSFILFLSVSVTCMSEFVISPAETLVTKELMISSRKDKAKKNTESRITKLSSAEAIADIDTVVITSPAVLIDSRHLVRRIFFADNKYRYDTLRSESLSSFYDEILPILAFSAKENLSKDMIAFKDYLIENNCEIDAKSYSTRPKFLRNYPTKGARSCVWEFDNDGRPTRYLFYTAVPSIISNCSKFRTEGGCLWDFDNSCIEKVYSEYRLYKDNNLSPTIFISSNNSELIFEGMIGVGAEYPFFDGNLAEEFAISAICPILFLDKENQKNLDFVNKCGIVTNAAEVAVASEYLKNSMNISDAPLTTKAYVGFDHTQLNTIIDRLLRNGRKVLPIIKDSVDRRAISPISVYATHSTESYDSIRISSSLSLQEADANHHKGGLFDTLKMIRGASIARLKLGVYRNYLAFSMLLRSVAICCSLLFGKSGSNISSVAIIFSGIICDAIAMIALMTSKGIPVRPQEAASDAKLMFSSTLFLLFSIIGALSGIAIFVITEVLIALGKIPLQCSSMFICYAIVLSQIASLGGFLVILNKRTRRKALNWAYVLLFVIVLGFLILQSYLPDSYFASLAFLNVVRVDYSLIPSVSLISLVPLLFVLLISKLLSSFSGKNFE